LDLFPLSWHHPVLEMWTQKDLMKNSFDTTPRGTANVVVLLLFLLLTRQLSWQAG